MKKIVVLFMAVILLPSLTGCHQRSEKMPDTAEPNEPKQTTTIPAANPTINPAEYYGAWYDERLPYNELKLNSDGTYSSALFGDGTFRLEDDTIILDSGDAKYVVQTFSDGQRLSYNNICYIRTPYSIPEAFLEELGESEGIFITISASECGNADIKYIGEDGSETSIEDKGERALCFSSVVQDLNTNPWYDGDDILIFGGFYADNGFVSSVTKVYTSFKIVAINYFLNSSDEEIDAVYQKELVLKTQDGTEHKVHMVYHGKTDEDSYIELSSDLFEEHVFRMNQFVGHTEPNITD